MEKKTFKEIRKSQRYTATYISEYLGISRPTLRSKEAGKSEWTLKEALRLCDLYKVDITTIAA